MAVLKGYCEHGVLQAALMEEGASAIEIEEFAHTWRIEKVKAKSVSMEGEPCAECRVRFESNMRIIKGY